MDRCAYIMTRGAHVGRQCKNYPTPDNQYCQTCLKKKSKIPGRSLADDEHEKSSAFILDKIKLVEQRQRQWESQWSFSRNGACAIQKQLDMTRDRLRDVEQREEEMKQTLTQLESSFSTVDDEWLTKWRKTGLSEEVIQELLIERQQARHQIVLSTQAFRVIKDIDYDDERKQQLQYTIYELEQELRSIEDVCSLDKQKWLDAKREISLLYSEYDARREYEEKQRELRVAAIAERR